MTDTVNVEPSSARHAAFDMEEGLLALPGSPPQWIWAFTCPAATCACRDAVVVSTPGDREAVREYGHRVADAWRTGAGYALVASELEGAITFTMDLDTLEVFPVAGDEQLTIAERPEVSAIVERFDDGLLDAVARLWHRGKGKPPPSAPAEDGAQLEIEGWSRGDMVVWDDVQQSLRRDLYVFGERVFEAVEVYCVDAGCDRRHAVVDFDALAPRGMPSPGHVDILEASATLYPAAAQHRERLTALWDAYRRRHRDYEDRFARRCSAMHELAARIVAAPPKPKVGRNEPCPCGSGKKHKKCCGAA